MTILVTNDDGIFAEGLWVLVNELKSIARVVVAAPDREQSAVGTAVTLLQPLRVHKVRPIVPEVDAYAVEGTPSDCVILGLSTLGGDDIDLVVSGINQGTNLGDDILISGTVSAALQGYLHGRHAISISIEAMDSHHLDAAARVTTLLAEWIHASDLPDSIFLNVNLPNLPLAEMKGVMITQLARGTHTNVAEEENNSKRKCYRIVRTKIDNTGDNQTDIWAIEQGNISITPLHTDLLNRSAPVIPDRLCHHLFQGLRTNGRNAT